VSWALPQTESRKAGGKTGDDAVQALDARAAFIVGDILSDNMARAPTFGTDSVLATRFWTAVKTGTSKDMRDNWAVGWSERYTVGVWVGNAGGEAMHSVSGTSGAAPIWAEIMGFCIAMCPVMRPGHPLACCSSKCSLVRWQAAARPSKARGEWFVEGTQQSLFAMDHVAGGAGSPAGKKAASPAALRLRPLCVSRARPMARFWRWTPIFRPTASACSWWRARPAWRPSRTGVTAACAGGW
jgi:penicillin-binding protein 1C